MRDGIDEAKKAEAGGLKFKHMEACLHALAQHHAEGHTYVPIRLMDNLFEDFLTAVAAYTEALGEIERLRAEAWARDKSHSHPGADGKPIRPEEPDWYKQIVGAHREMSEAARRTYVYPKGKEVGYAIIDANWPLSANGAVPGSPEAAAEVRKIVGMDVDMCTDAFDAMLEKLEERVVAAITRALQPVGFKAPASPTD